MDSIKNFFKDNKKRSKFYRVSGEATFSVDVTISGDAPYSACVLSVHAFNDLKRRIAIAAKYKWYRVYDTAKKEVSASGNTYHATPLDIGGKIIVEITPIEEGESGQARVEFGPFSLDPNLRKTLQGIIRSGGTRFVVDQIDAYSNSQLPKSSRASIGTNRSMSRSNVNCGNIVLFKNSLKITSEGGDEDLRIGLGEQYEIIAGPGQRAVTFLFRDREPDIFKLTGVSGTRLVCRMISRSARDIMIMSLRCFEAKQNLEDSVIFEKVKDDLNDKLSKDQNGIIDLITDHDGKSREIQYLYERNMKLAKENESLQNNVRNLEGELSRSVNFSLNQGNSRNGSSRNISRNNVKMTPILEEQENSKMNHNNKDIKLVEEKLKSEAMKSAKLALENQNLKERVTRLNENIKKMRYKELMESKLNVTTENFQREIKNLEGTLHKYASENKRLNHEISKRQNTFDNSMVKTTLDSEKRLLESEQRNAQLMSELIVLKSKVRRSDRTFVKQTGGNTTLNLNFKEDKEPIDDPFMADESHIHFQGGDKRAEKNQTLNLEKFLENDFSIIQPGGQARNERDDFKYQALQRDFDDLRKENNNLIKQIQMLRAELKSREDSTTEKNLINKLKIENNEIRKLADKLQRKNLDLVKEKNELRFKVDDLQRESIRGSKFSVSNDNKMSDLEFKIQTLEKTNMDLLKEIKILKELKNKSLTESQFEDLKMKYQHVKEDNERLKSISRGNSSHEVLDLKRKIKMLEEKLAQNSSRESTMGGNGISQAAYENLRKTNERLLQEIIRLNSQVKNNQSMMSDSMISNCNSVLYD